MKNRTSKMLSNSSTIETKREQQVLHIPAKTNVRRNEEQGRPYSSDEKPVSGSWGNFFKRKLFYRDENDGRDDIL